MKNKKITHQDLAQNQKSLKWRLDLILKKLTSIEKKDKILRSRKDGHF